MFHYILAPASCRENYTVFAWGKGSGDEQRAWFELYEEEDVSVFKLKYHDKILLHITQKELDNTRYRCRRSNELITHQDVLKAFEQAVDDNPDKSVYFMTRLIEANCFYNTLDRYKVPS